MVMNETVCSFEDNRDDLLVGYVYDEISSEHRATFERHLRECPACRREVNDLAAVRRQLADWTPPALSSLLNGASSAGAPAVTVGSRRSSWWDIPAWAQIAAAMLCLGAGAGLANVHLTYRDRQLSVTTGWHTQPAAVASTTGDSHVAPVATRADLTALEQQLRAELRSARPSPADLRAAASHADTSTDADVVRRVRALIRESEQRQQRELALRVAEVARDVQAQRQADLVRIDRTLGVLQNNTGMAVRRQEQLLNSLAVRVSQR
jgi:hypothetical protein